MRKPVCRPVAGAGQSLETAGVLLEIAGGWPVDSWQPQAADSVAGRLISVNPLFLDRNRYFPERIYAATG